MKLLVAVLSLLIQCCHSDVSVVIRNSQNITFVEERQKMKAEIEFYRNNAYNCGLTGKYTFMVINPVGGGATDTAPLWVYMHGGGSGFFDKNGDYFAVRDQTEDTWNHEETFDDLLSLIRHRAIRNNGKMKNNTLTRRFNDGYRMLVVSMCDHDQYLGMGTPYPNNPTGPDAQVNGLQATMAAIDYTAASYPTTNVYVHGTSAGSVGAYAVGLSYAAEDVFLNGVICDSVLGTRGVYIQDQLAGMPGYPQQEGYDPAAFSKKAGVWREEASLLPEAQIGAGFDGTPILQVGGLVDPQCAGDRETLPEASTDGFDNNCEWMAQPLKDLIASQPGSKHEVAQFEGEGHVPTIKIGAAHEVVDAFIDRVKFGKYSCGFRSRYPKAESGEKP